MMGRNGSSLNPDLLIAILCAVGTFIALGFVVSWEHVMHIVHIILYIYIYGTDPTHQYVQLV